MSIIRDVARQAGGSPTDDRASVTAIADNSRELLQALDEIFLAVNPRNDNLEHLAGYLEQ